MSSEPTVGCREVIVFGGDAVVGRTLELLLQSEDFEVRFVGETISNESGLLDGVRVVILCPGLSDEFLEAVFALVGGRTEETRLRVLELLSNSQTERAGTGWSLPWPCRTEELKQEIRAAL